MMDTAAVPRDFRAYLKRLWPLGYDYQAEALQESHLSRLYRTMHATRHDGGTPPLLESFVRDLDAGMTAERQKRGIVVRAVDWHTVNGIIEDVRAALGPPPTPMQAENNDAQAIPRSQVGSES